VARAEPLREERRRRREQAHAQHGNRREHADNRVRRVQVELNRRDQRAEADQLWSQRQRSEEERDEEWAPPQSTTAQEVASSSPACSMASRYVLFTQTTSRDFERSVDDHVVVERESACVLSRLIRKSLESLVMLRHRLIDREVSVVD